MTSIRNPVFARLHNRLAARQEERGNRALRSELLAGLSGRVIEVGPGKGLNFLRYPPEVTEVVAVEPEPFLRERAAETARTAPVRVRVVDGTAARLPADDGSVDAVAISGLLCSVPDPGLALEEFWRVLRPGGQLRFYEHVRSRDPAFAAVQRAADVLWPRMMGGCHVTRDPLPDIRRVFQIEACRGFRFPASAWCSPVAPRIIGTARKAP